ncbi:SCO family protein [Cohnella candidum]|uniref:SCO family protein n=1 Tax=Cohnella candidum TaxID=2674991 RepID=A0A3G3JT32_9BACL|nr:SCO family protein [Cohnella candidum]AYQ71354.1 SCO family protein [Cohnella candidum]
MEQEQKTAVSRKRYTFPLIVLAVCLVLGGYILWSQNSTSKYPKGADFSYTDTDGQTVTLKNTNGNVRLLYFFYSYCPDVCPPTTFLMSQVQDELKKTGDFGKDVEFLSVTIDPTRDTPERMKEFGGKLGADLSGWKFLRGDEKATAELAKKYQILVTKDEEGNFGHMNLIVLLDKKGRIRDWISANDYFANGKDNLPLSDFVKKITDLL